MSRSLLTAWLSLLPMAGCGVAAYGELTAALDAAESETTEASDGQDASTGGVTTSPPGPISTVTTDGEPSTSSTASGEPDDTTDTGAMQPPDNKPPSIYWMTAEPSKLTKAGPLTIDASFTADVEKLELYAGEQLLETLSPDALPHDFIITSDKYNGDTDVWLRAVDDGGLTDDSKPVPVTVALPESGSMVWKMIGDDVGVVHGLAITPFYNGIAIGGIKAEQGWPQAIVRYYDGTNTLRWQASAVYAEGATTALTVAPDGSLLAVGQVKKGQGFAPWLAKFGPLADIEFGPVIGNVMETATGVAVAPTGEIYVSGYVQTPDEGKYDAMLWAYSAEGEALWSVQWDNPEPGDDGKYLDQAHDIDMAPDGTLLVVGETMAEHPILNGTWVRRAFVQRRGQSGLLLGTWIADPFPDGASGFRVGRV